MSPRDFLDDDQQNMPNPAMNSGSARDFLDETFSPQQESLGASLGYAVPRMLVDLGKGAYNFAQKIPGYYRSSQTEVPGVINVLKQHPLHALGQATAGLAELGQNVFNYPHDIINYAANRLNLFPKDWNEKVQMGRMPDSEQDINAVFGEPQYPGEALLRGIPRNALNLMGAKALVQSMPHLTKYGATRTLNKARNLAANREIGTLNVNPELIEDARQFLPNTLPNRNALEAAQYGDYDTLFRLQSDVGKNAGDYAKSLFSAAERSHGRAGLEARNRLLDAIHENLQEQGHGDISSLLRQGQNDYRRYMAFRPYRNALAVGALGLTVPEEYNPVTKIAKKFLFHNSQ